MKSERRGVYIHLLCVAGCHLGPAPEGGAHSRQAPPLGSEAVQNHTCGGGSGWSLPS